MRTQDEADYNGWTNRETWLVALWIDNERALHEQSRDMARAALEWGTDRKPEGILADELGDVDREHESPRW